MNSINTIWINAGFEIKIILRSWFFRIFAGLSIIILFFLDMVFFSNVTDIPRIFNSISSFYPYANINLINIIQSAILVFFATDIIRRDTKLNTNEVFYIRSMTNAEYLFGKALGLFLVFFVLNLVALLMVAIYHMIYPDINFVFAPYLYYLLLMSFPSMIFVIGLSFLVMHLLKNQAITIILLLGYVAAVLFYLNDKFYSIFDFMPTNLPLIYSDFVGITHFDQILLQRGFYLVLGLILFLLTILLFKRLPQSQLMKKFSLIAIGILTILGFIFGFNFISTQISAESFRADLNNLNKKYKNIPSTKILSSNLDIIHQGNEIVANVKIKYTNPTEDNLDKYFFSLNPGLKVESIEGFNTNFQFTQDKHIITVTPEKPFKSDAIDSITIKYSGAIDERYCYLDVKDENLNKKFYIWMYIIDKKYSFINYNFVLLTAECNWYPVSGLPYGTNFPENQQQDFVDFKLNVQTKDNLTAISQGKAENLGDGKFVFTPENNLSEMSLVIAPYKKRSVLVDSVEYSLYTLPEHHYFENYFKQKSDTLASIIKESRQEYENLIGIDYPFKRFNVVEVPIQFFSYNRLWTVASSRVAPEMVFLPENGSYLDGTDFKFFQRMNERRGGGGGRRGPGPGPDMTTLTDLEKEAQMFKRFVDVTFLGADFRGRFRGELMSDQPDHNIFPNFYSYYIHFYSNSLALFNLALESYFYDLTNVSERVSSWFDSDLTTGEKISRKLDGHSLKELLTDSSQTELLPDILKTKGAQLIKIIQSNVNSEQMHELFCSTIENNKFNSSNLALITDAIKTKFGMDLMPYINEWLNSPKIPGFLIRDVELFKVLDNDRIRYQVLYKMSNPEDVIGISEVRFRYGNRPPFEDRDRDLETTRVIKFDPGQTKEIGFVLDDEPNVLYINPLIAKNIPLAHADRFNVAELREKFRPFDGERVLDINLKAENNDEIIIDNEDSTFQILSKAEQSFLKKLIYGENNETEQKFERFRFWDPAENWELLKSTGFYGNYIHSAYNIRAGQGDKKAEWTANLPESGNYSVYVYVINKHSFGPRDNFSENFKDIQYIVYHDDGTDEVSIDWSSAETGWNLIGSYYFSQGNSKIMITDKSDGKIIVADAVKWVKK